MCIHFSQSLKQKPIKYIGSKALLTLCAEMRVQSDLLITVNDTTVYSTSDKNFFLGAQWLSGRVLDSRPKGRGFEPHRRHCVVVLEQDTFILA